MLRINGDGAAIALTVFAEQVANAEFIRDLLRKYCQSDGGTITVYP